jgi:hypothetical protein
MDIGKAYFFKDGQVRFINLTITEEELDAACAEVDTHMIIPLVSSEEHGFNSNVNLTNTSTLEIYNQYIKAGYSIIRYCKTFDMDYTSANITLSTKCDCVVSLKITEEDAFNIKSVFESLEPKKAFDKGYVYNINRNMFNEIDYDYYDPSQNRGILSSEILPYFLKEKTNKLSLEEKEIVDTYRNFDLEKLLTYDIPKEYKLNNGNAGIMVIAPDNMYVSTCKKMQHKCEVDMILGHIRPDIDSNSDIMEYTEKSKSIIIQVCKGELIIWFPKHIKNYQANQIRTLIDFIKQINSRSKEAIIVSAAECSNGKFVPVIETNYMSNPTDSNNFLDDLNKYVDGIYRNIVIKGSKII